MKRKSLCNIVLLLLLSVAAFAKNDSIYCGTTVKLDIASPVIVPAANNWKIQQYEVAVNVRLAQRYYPTFELGYAGGSKTRGDSITYSGQGGFFRIGCDINPLRKHPESPHAMLIGVRLGSAVQQMEQINEGTSKISGVRGDCWGEIVAGCQVEIAKVNQTAFYMGWMGRFKCLFTRSYVVKTPANGQEAPRQKIQNAIYIPGYGKRDNIGWGLSYHLGWRF